MLNQMQLAMHNKPISIDINIENKLLRHKNKIGTKITEDK